MSDLTSAYNALSERIAEYRRRSWEAFAARLDATNPLVTIGADGYQEGDAPMENAFHWADYVDMGVNEPLDTGLLRDGEPFLLAADPDPIERVLNWEQNQDGLEWYLVSIMEVTT